MPFQIWSDEINYPEVSTFADLPSASGSTGEVVLVAATTGTLFINRKRAGLYRSDGATWERLGNIVLAGIERPGYLPSNPPSGKYTVTNLFVDPSTGKLTVEYDNTPV